MIAIQGELLNKRTMISQEVMDETHQRPGRIVAFFGAFRGSGPACLPDDSFLVEWADGTESRHRRDMFVATPDAGGEQT